MHPLNLTFHLLQSSPPNVSGSPHEGSMNVVREEVTSDHTDEKIIDEVDKHEEVIEVQDESYYKVNL